MKIFQTLLAIVLSGAILSVAGNVSAAAAKGTTAKSLGVGTVVRVVGKASYSLGDDKWHPLVPGKYLPPGSIIRTGDNGGVDVVLGKAVELPQVGIPGRVSFTPDAQVTDISSYKPYAEQNVVRLTPNTTLAIDTLGIIDTGADTLCDTELDLKKGKIYASVKKESIASTYLIKIPNGIAGIRGTIFSLSAEGDLVVFKSHTEGGGVSISLVSPDGSVHTFFVGEGQQLTINAIGSGTGAAGTPATGTPSTTGTKPTTTGTTPTTGAETTGTTTTTPTTTPTTPTTTTQTAGGNVTISPITPALTTAFQQLTPAIKTIFVPLGEYSSINSGNHDTTQTPVSSGASGQ